MTNALKALEAVEAALMYAYASYSDTSPTGRGVLPSMMQNELATLRAALTQPAEDRCFECDGELTIACLACACPEPAAVENEELQRLMAEATPGPWEFVDMTTTQDWAGEPSYQIKLGQYCIEDTRFYPTAPSFADAALIVAAINALPGMMAERNRMKEALDLVLQNAEASGSSYQERVKVIRRVVENAIVTLGEQP